MRIAVDFRFLAGGPNVVRRGTGRYTQHQLREVLQIDRENEYLLICHPGSDLALLLPEIRSAPNVRICYLPIEGMRNVDYPNQPDRALRLAAEYERWLASLGPDLYHATTPYQLDELVVTAVDCCPVVATMYDLIPVVYADLYWPPGAPFHDELQRALAFMSRADRLIAISESARDDTANYLGVPRGRIDLAYPFADPMFRRLPEGEAGRIMGELRRRLPIPETFFLSLIHIHHSKNPEALLEAYSRLPADVRRRAPLVIVFFLRDSDRLLLETWMERYQIRENVILTGLVSDDELIALYNAATVVVHPSRYEGFGLPVVEAMACGAPVITTTAASLPEVGGDAAILVDPDDVGGFTRAMGELIDDPARREEMRARGLAHVRRFNPEQLGRSTLESYRRTVAERQGRPARPRVAVWSSLPPLNCGIADYTTELLPELAGACDVSLFVGDGYMPDKQLFSQFPIHHHSAFEQIQRRRPFDAIVYQFGISTMHDFMYPAIRTYPGIVVIHDLHFASGMHYVYVNQRGRPAAFKQEVVAAEGPAVLREYESIERLRDGARAEALTEFLDRHYLLRWVVDNSLAQIVHMEQAAELLRARYPGARCYTIDMGAVDPWHGLPPLRPTAVRAHLGLPLSTYIVGVFGSVVPLKRLDTVVRSFAQVAAQQPDSMLLVVGEHHDIGYVERLRALAEDVGVGDRVTMVGRTDREAFDQYLLACDVIVNLRYPSRQQMSAILIRAIAAGKPVITTNLPEWGHFPEEFCWRVAPDEREVATLADQLRRLGQDLELRRSMGAAARRFYEERGNEVHSVRQYLEVIEEVAGGRLQEAAR